VPAARRHAALAVERGLARVTDAIVCVCEDELEVARASGIHGPLVVVRNGCPPCADVVPDDALAWDGPVVGAVSVLRRQKRLDLLVDAAPSVLEAVPEARIAIVGDGPEGPCLRRKAATLGAKIAFVPFRPPSGRALRHLDVYVLSSGWEALPIGLLEALACGVPQVVFDVGGNREAVSSETGVLVPPGNVHALAEGVVALLRDPARRARMAVASRARHAERFTAQRMIAETAALYDEVLSTRRARRGRPGSSRAGSRRRGRASSW
jgi:glycosyltransferase involved in cell wall biosynthesis